jgi:hypothetical protein
MEADFTWHFRVAWYTDIKCALMGRRKNRMMFVAISAYIGLRCSQRGCWSRSFRLGLLGWRTNIKKQNYTLVQTPEDSEQAYLFEMTTPALGEFSKGLLVRLKLPEVWHSSYSLQAYEDALNANVQTLWWDAVRLSSHPGVVKKKTCLWYDTKNTDTPPSHCLPNADHHGYSVKLQWLLC